MNLLDLLVNYAEAFIINFFISEYLLLKKKKKYLVISSIIIFLEITISNYINEFSQYLIPIIIISLILLIKIFTKKYSFMSLITCIIAIIILLLSNYISLFLTSIIFEISILELPKKLNVFYFSIIFSKLIFFLMVLLILHFNNKIVYRKIHNNWIKSSLLLTIILLMILALLIEALLTDDISHNMIMVLIISIIILTIIFIILFYKLQKENDLNLKYQLDIQKSFYTKENYLKIRKLNSQIKDIEHHMNYVLMQIKNNVINADYQQALITLDEYINKTKHLRSHIDTDNPYFNFILNDKISKLQIKHIYLKCTISIQKDEVYDNIEFCNFLTTLIDELVFIASKNIDIQFSITDLGEYIFIQLIFESNQIDSIRKTLDLSKDHIDYSIKELEKNCYLLKIVLQKISYFN